MFQPPAERDEHKKHGWRLEECLWTGGLLHGHGDHHHQHGVDVGDAGGQRDQHVHVRGAVLHRLVRVDVEISTTQDLKKGEKTGINPPALKPAKSGYIINRGSGGRGLISLLFNFADSMNFQ